MCKAQIYIKNMEKTLKEHKKIGRFVPQLGGLFPPRGE